ncbi:hypothetical protein [uncultured Rhodoblastus sp.]|uniref:hypothetical protein n=1 Tax=uncultured Rhodoblastus sp. TaxID=543037 RepID=UPI0025E2BE69|nr:hypothetical protein [uncultured Rhodoblastus sp.]
MWQSHLSYHPRIGYTYSPNFRGRLPHESGGYLVRANAAGFRCEHEFEPERAPGAFRALLFGDSQTAGLGVGNRHRYGDLLERAIPGLEIFNFAIDGVGVDQEYLAYLEHSGIAHDLVVIGLYVEDVSRVSSQHLRFNDEAGREIYYAKPFYRLDGGGLTLANVPVPKRPFTRDMLPQDPRAGMEAGGFLARARTALHAMAPDPRLRRAITGFGLGDLIRKAAGEQRAPGYESPDNPGWRLLAEILKNWIFRSGTPVLLMPIPMWAFVEEAADPAPYQTRYREFAIATRCHLHDPLPDLLSLPLAERRKLFFARDRHLTPLGHRVMADSLQPAIADIIRQGAIRQGAVLAATAEDRT